MTGMYGNSFISAQVYKVFMTYRNLRIYGTESKFKCLHSIAKLSVPDQVSVHKINVSVVVVHSLCG